MVDGNDRAIRLYKKLGFQHVGRIPGGFLLKAGVYQDIFVYYHTLSAAEGI
ncbi:GNAT family protein [Ruminococcus sp.]|uniref:GNAT family protein n=1 Tax=Ruminococcus sp. TaxID=41978 RepID=UPI002805B65B|nr:GNAT family protein [Ruminococcus sp.]MEE0022146.1 GNAT family protein [Ruminococcus sp.]